MIGRRIIFITGLMLLTSLGAAGKSAGQLISPGELSAPHQQLEGVTRCTSCHELGQKGISNQRCLKCHTPLRGLIRDSLGYHATVAKQNCADCHQEHYGKSFQTVHWDTTTFDHQQTGYPLIGKHRDLSCRKCHTPEFITNQAVVKFKTENHTLDQTFLGLDTTCTSCHQTDSPHGDQFTGQGCQQCHTPVDWKNLTVFDHDSTRYPLTGKHVSVSCDKCHLPEAVPDNRQMVRYTGIPFDRCTDCHDDPHKGKQGTVCTRCHATQGWDLFVSFDEKTFDHATTGFPLEGKHKTIACKACHDPKISQEGIRMTFVKSTLNFTYPHPEAKQCLSCHLDYHDGAFVKAKGGADCDNCHTAAAWQPVTYGIKRHNTDSRFDLTGAHLAVTCSACHQPKEQGALIFHFSNLKCDACHTADNPHGEEFRNTAGDAVCEECHSTSSWTTDIHFDHDSTKFALTGAHRTAPCQACHLVEKDQATEIAFPHQPGHLPLDCKGCHTADDPHHGQFAQSKVGTKCSDCHGTEAFTMESFDHSKTRFPLDGAHGKVSCAACHPTETGTDGKQFVRFRPLPVTCEGCHGTKI